jgi:hypothetical protein
MKSNRYGMTLAVKEHLLGGNPVTRLEAMILFGISNLPEVINGLRKNGNVVESRSIPYAAALKRVNEFVHVETPANLPIREIQVTDYWINE